MKRQAVLITTIGLVLSLSTFTQAATYGGGSGTAEDPYQIGSLVDWQTLMASSADWGGCFILTTDLNWGGISLTPVGNSTTPFTGNLDGNGHILSNVVINLLESDEIGLFGYLGSGGKIKNLGIENANIQGNFSTGGLVGWNAGTVMSCYVSGSIHSYSDYVGGLVGYNNSGILINCYTTCSVSGNSYVGGMIGENHSGTITASYSTGSISALPPGQIPTPVGGLVGLNSGTITSCYAAGSVHGYENVGGLVGYNLGTITSCYATGSVGGEMVNGGLVGCNSRGTITYCYATGHVNEGMLFSGGLVGLKSRGTLTACFWDIQTSGMMTSADGTGKTTAEMQTLSTFTDAGWDFTYIDGDSSNWWMPVNAYPLLFWELGANVMLLAPDGSETITAGRTVPITWTSTGSTSNVLLEYSINGGLDWTSVATVPNTGSYDWLVPLADSNDCLIKISDATKTVVGDISNSRFTIFVCRLDSVVDLNNDCKVNLSDLVLMAADWLSNGNPFDEGFTEVFDEIYWGGFIPQGIVTVDANLSDWTDAIWQPLDIVYYGSPTDVSSARFALKWNEVTQKVYMVVEVTDSEHVFSDAYVGWDAGDQLEIYCQGNPVGGSGHLGVYDFAQQYNVASTGTGDSWATWAKGEALAGDVGLEYATNVTGDPIVYEVAVRLFENYGGFNGTPTVVKTLSHGTKIGFDPVASTKHAAGFGMLSANELKWKVQDFSKLARYKLR